MSSKPPIKTPKALGLWGRVSLNHPIKKSRIPYLQKLSKGEPFERL
jgi:hypothetical protein